jgi:hypothetical protein
MYTFSVKRVPPSTPQVAKATEKHTVKNVSYRGIGNMFENVKKTQGCQSCGN